MPSGERRLSYNQSHVLTHLLFIHYQHLTPVPLPLLSPVASCITVPSWRTNKQNMKYLETWNDRYIRKYFSQWCVYGFEMVRTFLSPPSLAHQRKLDTIFSKKTKILQVGETRLSCMLFSTQFYVPYNWYRYFIFFI